MSRHTYMTQTALTCRACGPDSDEALPLKGMSITALIAAAEAYNLRHNHPELTCDGRLEFAQIAGIRLTHTEDGRNMVRARCPTCGWAGELPVSRKLFCHRALEPKPEPPKPEPALRAYGNRASVGRNSLHGGIVDIQGDAHALHLALATVRPLLDALEADGWRTEVTKNVGAGYVVVVLRSKRNVGGGALVLLRRHRLVELAQAVRAAWRAAK